MTSTPQEAGEITVDLPDLIVSLYRDSLRDNDIDQDSDFFECGGDSLAAFQITAGLADALGTEVPVALVFAYPSPVELAAVVG